MSGLDIKFELDEGALKSAIEDAVAEAVDGSEFDYECPSCGAAIKVRVGPDNACPECGQRINVVRDEIRL